MNAQDTVAPNACENPDQSGGESEIATEVQSAAATLPGTAEEVSSHGSDASSPVGDTGVSGDPGSANVGVNPGKLQQAIETLAHRVATARTHGATHGSDDVLSDDSEARSAESQDERPGLGWSDSEGGGYARDREHVDEHVRRIGATPPNSGHHLAALELRMKQIADLAGLPSTEHISADIAALRARMDRLARTDGALSSRMETIQRQLSHMRESLDTSNAPVVDRLAELETRLDEIGETLANRNLTSEARAAVEHSCGHIISAISRIEKIARESAPPAGTWDQIAGMRHSLARMATRDNVASLATRMQTVAERIDDLADRSDRSEAFAGLEQRLSEVAAATKTAAEEIRERPAYDPTDIRTLLERIEAWRSEKPKSDMPGVAVKIDSISRQIDRLSQVDHRATLSKIQDGLSQLVNLVSAQSRSLSGLDLVGLQERLGKICEDLATAGDDRGMREPNRLAGVPRETEVVHSPDDDVDHELAKELARRFAPDRAYERTPSGAEAASTVRDSEDVSGAFDAIQEALEALVGQIPFLERTWEAAGADPAHDGNTDQPSESEHRTGNKAPAETMKSASADPAGPADTEPAAYGGEHARLNRSLSSEKRRGEVGGMIQSASDAGRWRPDAATSDKRDLGSRTDTSSAPAWPPERGTPTDLRSPDSRGVGPNAASSIRSDRATPARIGYADAAHRIGTSSTWRKAKVAVVNANPPKY